MTQFLAKIRDTGQGSIEITIPATVVDLLKLKDGNICQFTIEKEGV